MPRDNKKSVVSTLTTLSTLIKKYGSVSQKGLWSHIKRQKENIQFFERNMAFF